MLQINTAQLRSGMVLERPIVSMDGNILINEGVRLTDKMISRMLRRRIRGIFIKDRNEEKQAV